MIMGIVKYNAAIEYVKGALSKPKKRDGHNHGSYLIGTHREAPTSNPNCTRAYVKDADAYKRNTPVTADELAVRNRFATVAQQVNTRAHNMSTYPADYAAFQAQKDQPGGKKTFRAYLWKVLGEVYDENQG